MVKPNYDEFLLEIGRLDEIKATWEWQEEQGPRQRHTEDEIGLSDQYARWVKTDVPRLQRDGLNETELQRLGELLYNALFPGSIAQLFDQAVETVRQHPGRRLSVSISVDRENEKVRGWPLEFLRCTSRGGYWLSTTKNNLITLSRRMQLKMQDVGYPSHSPPLKVLIVVSKPTDRDPVMTTAIEDIAKWATTEIAEETYDIDARLLGHIEAFEQDPALRYLDLPATLENLSQVIDDWPPDVLHFVGHGRFHREQGDLALVNDAGKVWWCSARDFAELCVGWRPGLVLLQACESAKSGAGAGFWSVAAQLMEHNIPAVVAMQFEIRNDCATEFARGFYEALAKGADIDEAVQRGRWKIAYSSALDVHWSERHFGTPVLFTLGPYGIIHPLSPGPQQMQPSQPLVGMSGVVRSYRPEPQPRDVFGTEPSARDLASQLLGKAAKAAKTGQAKLADTLTKAALALLQPDIGDQDRAKQLHDQDKFSGTPSAPGS